MRIESRQAYAEHTAAGGQSSVSLTDATLSAIAKSAIEDPINSVGQIVNRTANKYLVPEVHLTYSQPEPEFNTPAWYAQHFGAALGMIPAFLLVRKGVRLARPGLAGGIAESAITGAAYEGLLRPVQDDQPFLKTRLTNSAIGAATFGSMEVAGSKMSGLGRTTLMETLPAKLRRPIVESTAATASGAIGGVVNAEASSLINQGRLATGKEVWRSAYSFAIVGAGLAAVDGAANRIGRPALIEGKVDISADLPHSILRGNTTAKLAFARGAARAIGEKAPFPFCENTAKPAERAQDDKSLFSRLLSTGPMEIIAGKRHEVEALLGKRPELDRVNEKEKLDSWDHEGVIVARVTGPDGTPIEAMVRTLNSSNPFDLFKFERSQQAATMHQLMGFEHGVPAVGERAVEVTTVDAKGAPKPELELRRIWLEQKVGENIEDGMRRMAKEKYGEGKDTDADVVQLINDHPQLRDRLEDAFLERILNGDLDVTAGNMVFEKSGSAPGHPASIQNIDHAQSFSPVTVPSWSSNSGFWITDSLRKLFANKPLSERNQGRIDAFLKTHGTQKGQADITERSALYSEQVSAYVARAQELLTKGFPEALDIIDVRYDEVYTPQMQVSREFFKTHPPRHPLAPKNEQ